MQITPSMGRRWTMLATMMVMPGGLILLATIALIVLTARTGRGQRLLVGVKRLVPPRMRALVRRGLALAKAENIFSAGPPSVHSASTRLPSARAELNATGA